MRFAGGQASSFQAASVALLLAGDGGWGGAVAGAGPPQGAERANSRLAAETRAPQCESKEGASPSLPSAEGRPVAGPAEQSQSGQALFRGLHTHYVTDQADGQRKCPQQCRPNLRKG